MVKGAKFSGGGVLLSTVLVFSFLMLSCSAQQGGGTGTAAPGSRGGNAGTSGTTGSSGSGGFQSSGGTSSGGAGGRSGGAAGSEKICADVHVEATRIKPWILFVIDRSGSTAEAYQGSSSKWQALFDALMDPSTGVITTLESVAFFGVVLFDGGEYNVMGGVGGAITSIICLIPGLCPDGGVPATTTVIDGGAVLSADGAVACPRIITVPPALNNAAAVDAAYRPAGPGGTTPAELALKTAYSLVPTQQQILDQEIGPQFVIYATDGEPNGCEGGSFTGGGTSGGAAVEQAVVNQVTAAAGNGIKTYVIGVAVNQQAQAHLEQVAQAGGTGMQAFSPSTKDDLVSAIRQIVGGALGCKVQLNGKVAEGEDPCKGKVVLNSVELVCNDPNGWKLASESEIELQGKACDDFMNNPTAILSAGFPCGVFILQ